MHQGLQHDAAPQLFHHDHHFDRPHPHAAVFVPEKKGRKPERRKLGVDLLGEAIRPLDLPPPLEAVAAPYPVADGFAQLILFGREIKVHDRS